MSDSLATQCIVARQAPLSRRFPMQECWGGLLFPSPGDLPKPRIKSAPSVLAGGFFITESPGKPFLIKGEGERESGRYERKGRWEKQ